MKEHSKIYLVTSAEYGEGHLDWCEDPIDGTESIPYVIESQYKAVVAELEAAQNEIEKLNKIKKEMSELCLTNAEADKMMADGIREAVKECYAEGRLRNDTMRSFCFVRDLTLYADKLERGES